MRGLAIAALWALCGFGCDDGGGGGGDPTNPDGAVVDAGPADGGGSEDAGADGPAPDMAQAAGALTADPLALDFGAVAVGASGELMLSLANPGPGATVVEAYDGLAAPFSVSRQPPINVPPEAARTLIVTFRPADAGPVEQVVTFRSEAGDAVEVTLSGAGVVPEGALRTPVIDFGVVAPGTMNGELIEVENTSDAAPLRVTAVTGVMAPFSVPMGQVPTTAGAGETARVVINFQSEVEGDFEQSVTVVTDAGDFPVTVRGRVVAVGDVVLRGAEPAWAPTGQETRLTIHGGPFGAAPTRITVGEIELTDLALVDAERVQGTLAAEGPLGLQDVRVEVDEAFGVQPGALTRTPPVAEGSALDAAAWLGESLDPEGNPWRLDAAVVPAEADITLAPGVVILADGATLTVDGVVRTGAEPGQVVFSAMALEAGAWGGIVISANEVASTLSGVVVEYAGADGAAVRSAQAASFVDLVVRHSASDGVALDDGGTLIALGGVFTDLTGDAMSVLTADASIFRLERTWVRRARWALAAVPVHFGGRPLGQGNDWSGNARAGVGLGGEVAADATLGNQPEGVRYGVRAPIEIRAGAALTLVRTAPLTLNGLVRASGTFRLPAGTRLRTAPGGGIAVEPGGQLIASGAEGAPVILDSDLGGGAAPLPWGGIDVAAGGQATINQLRVLNAGVEGAPAVRFGGDFQRITGLTIQGSGGPALALAGGGEILDLVVGGNAQGVVITGGMGRLVGESGPPVDGPAVVFEPADLCPAWDVSGLRDFDGMPVETVCAE